MEYAKIINGSPSFAPNPILHNGVRIGNPPPEVYAAEGYKPVVYTDKPAEHPVGKVWEEAWTEDEGNIIQQWVLADEGDLSPEEALDLLFGGEG